MTINYNVTGAKRKRLAEALGEFVHSEVIYQKAPTYAYTVGLYTVDNNGVITAPEDAPETEDEVIAALSEHGFKPALEDKPAEDQPAKAPKAKAPKKGRKAADVALEPEADNHPEDAPAGPTEAPETPDVADGPEPGSQPEEKPEEAPEVPKEAPPEAPAKDEESGVIMTPVGDNRLTISIPRKSISDLALQRLMQLLENKEPLFKRALKADDLPVVIEDDTISFPWFTLRGEKGEKAAYGQFVEALCQMAKEQTRILAKPYVEGNDRFAMRIFMVRMGMKGPQYALIRKLMMGHLTGNSGWRFGTPPKKGLEITENTTEAPADAAEEAADPEDEPLTADTAEAGTPEPETTEADASAAEATEADASAAEATEADAQEPEAAEADTTEDDAQEPEIPEPDTSSDAPADDTTDTPFEPAGSEESVLAAEEVTEDEPPVEPADDGSVLEELLLQKG